MNRLPTLLRPARAEDCPAIYDVHRYAVRFTCLQSYNETVLNAWLPLLDPRIYAEALSNAAKELWVIEYRNRLHGFFQIDLERAQLDALYVHPFVHKQGLGTALLNRAEERMAKANHSIISLYASENSTPFYLINGYESLGNAVMPLNETVNAGCRLMRKHLL